MSQWRLTLLLFTPSWLSFGVCAGLTLFIIGVSNWSYFTYNGVLFDFFYGGHGVVTTLEQAPGAVNFEQITSNTTLYGVGVVALAAAVAVAVFFMVRGAERGVGVAAHVGQGIDRREYVQHALLRLLILALWAGYALLTVNILLPTVLLFSRIGAEDLLAPAGMATSVGAVVAFWLMVHGHVVFARLVCLRPRVFGGEAVIEGVMIR